MGMPVRVTVYAPEAEASRDAVRAAFDRIAALDRMMSDYRADSELRQLAQRGGEWVAVSSELFAAMARAVEIAEATDGAFDPTVAPLVALWRDARQTRRMPDRARLARARALVGWRQIELDRRRGAIRIARGGQLDLGGIAKGFILQEALGTLRARGLPRALLEAGGDLVAGHAPPDREGWRVELSGVSHAFAARAAALTNAALATSGSTAQFVEIDGVRYSHVVDPRTGLGVTHDFMVHVMDADAATADALATALLVAGANRRDDVTARFPGALVDVHVARR